MLRSTKGSRAGPLEHKIIAVSTVRLFFFFLSFLVLARRAKPNDAKVLSDIFCQREWEVVRKAGNVDKRMHAFSLRV